MTSTSPKERPRQYKRVGQIDVNRRDGEHVQIVGIGNAPEEMNARDIDVAADFVEQRLSPSFPASGAPSVADIVAANDQHDRLLAPSEQIGQRPHEKVEAAIGLERSRDKSDDLTRRMKGLPVAQGVPRLWLRPHLPRRDAVVKHAQMFTNRPRKLLPLPFRRRDCGIGVFEGEHCRYISEADKRTMSSEIGNSGSKSCRCPRRCRSTPYMKSAWPSETRP